MKKFYFLLPLIALFVVACESDSTDVPSGENPLAVSFSSAITSRATDTAFESGDEISVTAYSADGSIYEQNVSYTYSGSSFSSSDPIEYEDAEHELSFRAVYPYVDVPENKIINFEVKGDQSSGSNYTLSDLLSSYCGSTSSTTPKLTFEHLLTKVIINITSADVEMVNVVATLNAMTNVECDLSTLNITTTGSASAITMASNGVLSYKAIIAPQTITSASPLGAITVNGNSYTFYYTSNVTMAAGKEYTFPAKIFNGEIIFDEPLINDWDKGEVTADELTLASFSATSYPTNIDTWVITDATATTDDFAGLKAALVAVAAEDETREISLEFSNLEEFSDYAIDMSGYKDIHQALCSVSAPVATTFGISTFYCCTSLESVSLPEATTFERGGIFVSCTSLVSVSLPKATTFGNSIFSGCTSLVSVSLPRATTFRGSTFYCCTSLESVYLPEATTFESSTFSGCTSLESISLPIATTFGQYTFFACSTLESISLPKATTFSGDTFRECAALESVSLPVATTFGNGEFKECTALKNISLPKATTFGSGAFFKCTSLNSVSLPEVTTFGNSTFYDCTLITDISIATKSGVMINAFPYGCNYDLSNITLTIGSANSSMIDGLYFRAPDGNGGISGYGEFKAINIVQ